MTFKTQIGIDTAHGLGDLSVVFARCHEGRRLHDYAAASYTEAAGFYSECGCTVLAGWAADMATEALTAHRLVSTVGNFNRVTP